MGVAGKAKREKRKNIWLGLDIYREDSRVCWRLPVVFFAVLPCGANGDSMCDEPGHPKVAPKTQPPLPWMKSLNIR